MYEIKCIKYESKYILRAYLWVFVLQKQLSSGLILFIPKPSFQVCLFSWWKYE